MPSSPTPLSATRTAKASEPISTSILVATSTKPSHSTGLSNRPTQAFSAIYLPIWISASKLQPMANLIERRDDLVLIPKAPDVSTKVSLITVDGNEVLAVQDITLSTQRIGRGWYVTKDTNGRACARLLAAALLAFADVE